jgi:hypothetical protein
MSRRPRRACLTSRLLSDPDWEKARRVMQAMLSMRKIEVEGLEPAAAQSQPVSPGRGR